MKKYTVQPNNIFTFPHEHPERTAYRPFTTYMNFDILCQVWPSRGAMLQACKMSNTGELGKTYWKPVVKE